ncbi:NAD(P)H-dependent oxidoreductase [Afifella sp. IM 167]|uniref:NAD(P)H-dependent oxidoreductase n=1 Tax=Afifella sp. IM 167 TaxID=2033586 RepID=UPI001CC94BCC|nr:dehydrogenase [Afifella sp. IM 167]
MPRTIAVIQGHPDPSGGHLCHALADAYAEGASDAGHRILRVDVAGIDLDMLERREDHPGHKLPSELRSAEEAFLEADHIVFVFPLWLGLPPARLKAFFEQLLRPGLFYIHRKRGFPKPLLTGRSARLVVTMRTPIPAYRLYYRSHGLKAVKRHILDLVGIRPVRESLFGDVEKASAAKVEIWLAKLRQLGVEGK